MSRSDNTGERQSSIVAARSISENREVEAIPADILFPSRDVAAMDIAAFWTLLAERLGTSGPHTALRLGATLEMPVLGLPDLNALHPDFDVLGYTEALQRAALVLRHSDSSDEGISTKDVSIAVADPLDSDLQTWLHGKLLAASHKAGTPTHGTQNGPIRIRWCIVHPQDLQVYFSEQESRLQSMDSALANVQPQEDGNGDTVDDLSMVSIAQDRSPIVRLVNSTILDAMKVQASDIHLECVASGLQIKYRIDGVLSSAGHMPGREAANQVVSRIKVMAELDISEQRVPQDGRFKLSVQGRDVDFRVSVMPSLFGEDVVIRILDKRLLTTQMQRLSLDMLGYEGQMLRNVRNLAKESYGMLLVTGPTGSGKTTTLYAALTEINHGDMKIVTIEDPIEYELPGILQIPVNEKKGLTFARGLRSILRHDPDKILVGEIRDSETAQIAVQSALTGHLVFTSVHANNVFDVLGRFLHLGVDTYSFVSALNGVLAQRLVRVICSHCKEPHAVDIGELDEAVGKDCGINLSQVKLFRGKGCEMCRGTGYKGRRAISELLMLDDQMRELIIARAPIRALKDLARSTGTVFLRDAAVHAALAGWTTLDEVNRVAFAH